MPVPQSDTRGLAFIISAVACFAAFDTLTKWIGATAPLVMVIWFRYVFQASVTACVLLPVRGRSLVRTTRPHLQMLRGMLLVLISVLAFLSLKYLPVAEFTAISMITPLAITFLATLMIGEEVSIQRWLFLLGGFAGALMVVRPGGESFTWPMLLPLGFVLVNALFQVVTSLLAKVDDAETTHFYTGVVGALLLSMAVPFAWHTALSWRHWAVMIAMGIASSLGHYFLIKAYSYSPVAVLTPYLYGQIAFAALGGWVMFSHVPDAWSFAGMCVIGACGVTGTWMSARTQRLPAIGSGMV